jgi:glucose/arabinose dehydrogenase
VRSGPTVCSRRRRAFRAGLTLGALLAGAPAARGLVAAPAISEPAQEGQVISPYDVHMVAGPFEGSPGERHLCSDWELVAVASLETVWSASCVTGALAVHIHLGDGTFTGALAGRRQLDAAGDYRLRVRFAGDAVPGGDWSPWSERNFHTEAATVVEPLVLSDVSVVPPPRWRDASGRDVVLPPAAGSPAALEVGVPGSGLLLRFAGGDGLTNAIENPSPFDGHGPVRIDVAAGRVPVAIPASTVSFTDGSGADREIALPALALDPGQSASYWISAAGEAFLPAPGAPASTPPTLSESNRVSAARVPWSVEVPGFRVERVATGFRLPVEIAFVPSPAAGDDAPFLYVSELYGSIAVVSRSGAVSPYATGLLNFDPLGTFPGSGEKGLTGIAVEPGSGDLFAGTLEAQPGVADFHFPMVVRLHSTDGGHMASNRTTILDFPNEPVGPSHQISNLSIGPDGKLYVHIGDGLLTTPAQDMTSVRGKILRVNLDGTAPADNPFYDASDGRTAKDLIYALGFRNPFGGSWRAADGSQWEVENGPSVDRLAKVVAGRNYLWDGTDASMTNFAAYNWTQAVAPVNIAFVQPSTFSGSGFPAEHQDRAFVTESGPTWSAGPQAYGKRISEFSFDAQGSLVSGPLPLVQYVGAGRGTAAALAAGPDGLYFSDLYEDFGSSSGADAGASVFRIRYVGVADFTGSPSSGRGPLDVAFEDASSVPGASAWHWDFGDGETGDGPDPVHRYAYPGTYDVRLTVTGSAGPVARQKAAFVVIASPPRTPDCCALPPAPRRLAPRQAPGWPSPGL